MAAAVPCNSWESDVEVGGVLSLFSPGFQIVVIFKSKCNEVAIVLIDVTSFSNYIY